MNGWIIAGSWLASVIGAGIVASLFARAAHRKGVEAIREQAFHDGHGEGIRVARVATRASLRDALTTLPRLRCSRSISGHVRLADVERLLGEVRDE